MKRRTYKPIRIDFTPFVNVALLLIVFFVWLKTAERLNVMQMNIPGGFNCYYGEYPAADATVFLLSDNRIGFLTYHNDEAEFLETDYSAEGIRKQLMSITLNHEYGAIVVVTPTEQATFKNLVDIVDEIRIAGPVRFQLSEKLTSRDRVLVDQVERYKKSWLRIPLSIHLPLSTKSL